MVNSKTVYFKMIEYLKVLTSRGMVITLLLHLSFYVTWNMLIL